MGAIAWGGAASGEDKAVAPVAYTAADFAQLPPVEEPTLSPDGTLIAAKIAKDGEQFLGIFPIVGDGKPRFVHAGDVDLNWWRWVGNRYLVIGVGQTVPVLGDEMYVRRAYSIDATTGALKMLSPREAAQSADDVIWASSDGKPRIMLSYQTSVFLHDAGFWPEVQEIDLETGKKHLVQRSSERIQGWYADSAGTVRMGVGYPDDGRSIRVVYRAKPGAGLDTIVRARRGSESVPLPSIFPTNGSNALMIADDDDGFSALYELDLATMTRGKQLANSPGFDIAGLRTDPSEATLWGIAFNEDRRSTRWIDPDMKALADELATRVKNGGASIVSVSADRQKAIFHVGSASAPGAHMLFDRKSGEVQMLAFTNPVMKMRQLRTVRTYRYTARDGLPIAAVLTLPRGEARNRPLIVMPHGGPFARDTEEWDWWAQFLADRGYVVVQPNYRGSSGYGTRFTEKGEGQWGLSMQDDLLDAVAALAKEGVADPKRACIVGASYGGYAAERSAERDPGAFRCAVSYAGVSDLKAMKAYDSQFLYAGARADWLKKQAPDLAAVSPINAVARFSTPLLLVHGAKDRVVPVKQSRHLARKLKDAGKAVTYIEQPLADHHFSRQEDRLQFLEALDAFLKEHNPA